jgi:hypothetical protein
MVNAESTCTPTRHFVRRWTPPGPKLQRVAPKTSNLRAIARQSPKHWQGLACNLPWKHVGIGLGVDIMRVFVEAKGNDYPGIDFVGSVNFNLIGGQLYLKFYL